MTLFSPRVGVILCEQHGRSGVELVCTHLDALLQANAHRVQGLLVEDDLMPGVFVCTRCHSRFSGASEEERVEFFFEPRRPWCGLCLRARLESR